MTEIGKSKNLDFSPVKKLRPSARSILKNQAGLTLIEAIGAAALVGGVALLIANMNFLRDDRTKYKRLCDGVVYSLVNSVRGGGVYTDINNFFPFAVGGSASSHQMNNRFANDPGTTGDLLPNPTAGDQSLYWTVNPSNPQAFQVFSKNGADWDAPYLSNAQLIQGSLRTITSIYNQTPGIRCAWGTYDKLTNLSDTNVNFRNLILTTLLKAAASGTITAEIRMDPYDLATLQTQSCATYSQLHLKPGVALPGNAAVNAFLTGSANVAPPPGAGWPTNPTTVANIEPALPTDVGFPLGYGAGACTALNTPAGCVPNSALTMNTVKSLVAQYSSGSVHFPVDTLGVKVGVRLSFVVDGNTYNCSSETMAQYPRDDVQPNPPDIVRIAPNSNSTLGAGQGVCGAPAGAPNAAYTGDIAIDIGYSMAAGNMDRGSQLLCKDLSYIRGTTPYPIGSWPQPDLLRAGNVLYSDLRVGVGSDVVTHAPAPPPTASLPSSYGDNGSSIPCVSTYGHGANTFGVDYGTGVDNVMSQVPALNWTNVIATTAPTANPARFRRQANAAGEGIYVPCAQLTLCGRPVSSMDFVECADAACTTTNAVVPANTNITMDPAATHLPYFNFKPGGTGNSDLIRFHFNGLPAGCVAQLEVIAVDPAGNRSTTTAANRRYLNITDAAGGAMPTDGVSEVNVVRKPMCGNAANAYLPHAISYPGRGVYCQPNATWDDDYPTNPLASNPAAGWRAVFPNGYFTCRGDQPGFPAAGDGTSAGCCHNWEGQLGNGLPGNCTPLN